MTLDSNELVEPEITKDVLNARKAKLDAEAIALNQSIQLVQRDIRFHLSKIPDLEVQNKNFDYSLYRVKKELNKIEALLKD